MLCIAEAAEFIVADWTRVYGRTCSSQGSSLAWS